MRNLWILFLLSSIFLVPRVASAQMSKEHPQQEMGEEKQSSVEVGNEICPVSGEKIEEKERYQVTYRGKIYNLCCKMCARDFKRDPERYIQRLKDLEKKEESGKRQH